ncbi:hypothetical protein [Mesorhizobium sp. KR1-2]|uniref:hypothetical protein n=1 Tax=Mesorhizobium sp. KR1-2 TaxID=3156609 RepID=UPI0032B61789
MRILRCCGFALLGAFLMAAPASADARFVFGGDTYVSGTSAKLSEPSPRDALAAGYSVDITGKVEKDAHAAGFDVDVDAPVGEDLYAAGFAVKVSQPVGGDLTASGFDVDVRQGATIGGNARIGGGTITIDAPISGSLLARGRSLTVNAPIAGDARLAAAKLTFGPDAKIGGELTYSAPEPIEIAPGVIAPDKVHFEKLEPFGEMGFFRQNVRMPHLWPSFLAVFFSFLVTLAFLFVAAAILLAVAPLTVESLRERTIRRPFLSMGLGVLGLGMLIGLIPISAMSVIGIPLIPVILLAITVFWVAGYLLGIYALSWRVADALGELPTTMSARLAVLFIGLVIAAALNFIPFFGWLINLLILFMGLGGLVAWILDALSRRTPAAEVPPQQPADVPRGNTKT